MVNDPDTVDVVWTPGGPVIRRPGESDLIFGARVDAVRARARKVARDLADAQTPPPDPVQRFLRCFGAERR